MNEHLLRHGDKPFACPVEGCPISCEVSSQLQVHLLRHTEENPWMFTVEGSGKRSTTNRTEQKHKRSRTGKRSFVCCWEHCRRAFSGPHKLKEHLHRHTGKKPFACPVEGCARRSATRSDAKRHQDWHSGNKPFLCPYEGCARRFGQSGNLGVHLRWHARARLRTSSQENAQSCFSAALLQAYPGDSGAGKRFVCPFEYCCKPFGRLSSLRQHLRLHIGDQRFVCPVEDCRKQLRCSADLTAHVRVHTREQPFICPHEDCRNRFRHVASLRVHLRGHAGDKRFVCPYEDCAKAFVQSSNLGVHLRHHVEVKPGRHPRKDRARHYTAAPPARGRQPRQAGEPRLAGPQAYCAKAFAHPASLTWHRRQHTAPKTFVCQHEGCGKSYKKAGELYRHLSIHSRTKPGVCSHEDGTKVRSGQHRMKPLRIAVRDQPSGDPQKDGSKAQVVARQLRRQLRTRSEKFPGPGPAKEESAGSRAQTSWHEYACTPADETLWHLPEGPTAADLARGQTASGPAMPGAGQGDYGPYGQPLWPHQGEHQSSVACLSDEAHLAVMPLEEPGQERSPGLDIGILFPLLSLSDEELRRLSREGSAAPLLPLADESLSAFLWPWQHPGTAELDFMLALATGDRNAL
ncbi:MAG: C2H2-type zinc finger protein [Kistimonas sp.]|nr:C2H2-type zinc finger protein [Kistimonas sp.]